ncbi:MAG: HAD-IIA family hydrolase [Nanoarchaeota archaeon]|nr:HAD-IIA family hydrolase [Nanoarchaeota archaeon]MBU4300883.1 HAD-IIA family hydrolase [Nanoarchaeota archaeon]MBU4451411.1 HAD-IIA family hydrolase [Nanoarchaeota archaeon]MCG2724515.1 HAD-IIA family hydrolase [archaeon]
MTSIYFNYKNVKTFIFDLDGTVWNWNSLFPNMAETIKKLKARNRKVFYVSDNNILSRKGLAERLTQMGIPTKTEEIVTAPYAAARYFKEKRIKNVYAIGEKGLMDELSNFNITVSDKSDIVLTSIDRGFTFWKLKTACDLIREGSKLYSTGLSTYWRVNGDILPAELPIQKAIEAVTGETATILGKPSDHLKKVVLEEFFLYPEDTLFIGDDIKTDMPFAHKCSFRSAIVTHGLTTHKMALEARGEEKPDAIINDIKELANLI